MGRWLTGPSTDSCDGRTRVRPRVGDGRGREVAADERGPGVSDRGQRRARGVNWDGSRLGWAECTGDARTRGRDEGLPADFNEMGRDAKQGWDRGGGGLW
jgi:hypothetical protein